MNYGDDSLKKVYKICIGIRHERNFGIMDSSGKIIDLIIRPSESPFEKGFFSMVEESSKRVMRLEADKGESYIVITTDDLIFEYLLKQDFQNEFNWIVSKCIPFFVKNILKPYKVVDYQRLGVIFYHKFAVPEFLNQVVSDITANKILVPDSFIMRFSKKIPVDKALAMKNINDFGNVIITLNKSELSFEANIDIQHYFIPVIEQLDDYDYLGFFQKAKDKLISTYHPMLEEKYLAKKEQKIG